MESENLYKSFKHLVMRVLYRYPSLFREMRYRFWQMTLRTGVRNEKELEVLPRLIHPGMTVVDVGAHCGRYTLPLSRMVGERGRVFSFEPVAENYHILRRLLSKHGTSNVLLLKIALGDSACKSSIITPITSKGINNYSCSAMISQSRGTEEYGGLYQSVSVDSLDSFFLNKGIEDCGYVKIDVEGYELFVLRGGTSFLRRFMPLVQCEIVDLNTLNYGYGPEDLVSFMTGLGYVMHVYGEHLKPVSEVSGDFFNYIFVPEGMVEQINRAYFCSKSDL